MKARLKNYTLPFLKDYGIISIFTIIIFACIRVAEFYYASSTLNEDLSLSLLFSKSIKYDSLFLLNLSAFLIIPAYLLAILNFLTYKIIIRVLFFIIVLIQLVFTQYFLTNSTILTSILLEFSISELVQIAQHEVSGNRIYFWVLDISILCLTLFVFIIRTKWLFEKKINVFISAFTALLFVGLISINNLSKQHQAFDSNFEYLIANSKPILFINSYLNANRNINDSELTKKLAIINFQDFSSSRNYFDQKYPLVYDSKDKNVLGPFFNQSKTLPNIVIIISESLSGSFSGKTNCIGGSLTPFLDSLSNRGLLWTHFLANADRSFGALSNILASLPYGTNERGFTGMNYIGDYKQKYPNQTSLIQFLKASGYQTNYYFGGWKDFDKINYFMQSNGIERFTSDEDFDLTKYQKKSVGSGQQVWGFNDSALYQQSIDNLEKHQDNRPFLNIYQTLTNHSPYNLASVNYFDRQYLEKRLNASGQTLDKIIIPAPIIGSVMAADDDLRNFFKRLSKHDNFKSTIFIIVGDHAVNLNLRSHNLERFHVPLVIYSPQIKQPAIFKGMCSHIDIAPSILALLEGNFDLKADPKKHFIGTGLDTSSKFTANHFIPLTINREDLPSFIFRDQLIYGSSIATLDSLWQTKKSSQETKTQALEWFQSYKILNRLLCNENRIWEQNSGIHHNQYFKK